MFRSGIEMELLAQTKIDDYYANLDRPRLEPKPTNLTFVRSMRRRFGLRLIAAGTRLAGGDLIATARPAMAGRS